jgi:adenylosuccinate synthase
LIYVVLGLQFGDEGKGKITDFLSDRFDVVVRFNGGGNAGHTVVDEGKTYKFHLLPSGSLRASTVVLGNGMVIDPVALIEEMKGVENLTTRTRVVISKMAHVVTPIHKTLDSREEQLRGRLSIGTTAQGIGPTYEDKYARTGIRMMDLLDRDIIRDKIETIYRMKEKLLEDTAYSDANAREKVVDELFDAGNKLGKFLQYSEDLIYEEYRKGHNIIFEGAQGTMLDIDFGMYPYVTSSNALSGALSLGAGFPFRKVNTVMGVVKAYVSRVGAGPFPTELTGTAADHLRDLGHEYGTTTGRPRRVGWLDLPMLKYAIKLNDVDTIALTKLDTLGQMDEVKVCTGYSRDGKPLEHIPRTVSETAGLELQFKSFKPWGKIGPDRDGKMVYEDLPAKARDYVEYIEKELGVTVGLISMGESRKSTIERMKH